MNKYNLVCRQEKCPLMGKLVDITTAESNNSLIYPEIKEPYISTPICQEDNCSLRGNTGCILSD